MNAFIADERIETRGKCFMLLGEDIFLSQIERSVAPPIRHGFTSGIGDGLCRFAMEMFEKTPQMTQAILQFELRCNRSIVAFGRVQDADHVAAKAKRLKI